MERKIFCIVIFTASFFFIIRKIHQRFIWALRRQSDGKVVDKLPRRRKFQKWRIDHPRRSSKFCLLHAFISLMHFTRSLARSLARSLEYARSLKLERERMEGNYSQARENCRRRAHARCPFVRREILTSLLFAN